MPKIIEDTLYVYVDIHGFLNLAGAMQFIYDNPSDNEQISAKFTYDQEYLHNNESFSLDPINLPLSDREFIGNSRYNTLGALFDAAPDAWGRRIIKNNSGQVSEQDILLKGKGNNVGAILFSSVLTRKKIKRSIFKHALSISQLGEVATLIHNIEQGKPISDSSHASFLESSWDIGGARPKTIIKKDNELYIVKFAQKNDYYNVQKLEHASLQMAKDCGIRVSDTFVIDTDSGSALFVKRFDRDNQQRQHYLSAASLISPPANLTKYEIDTRRGKIYLSYQRIADVIKKISSNPTHDLLELFTRMVFNVFIHNTDDHLKNTGFLKNENGYRLSPMFDVLTHSGKKHMLHIGEEGRLGTLSNILSEYKKFGIKNEEIAYSIIYKVNSIVQNRQQYYVNAGLSTEDISKINNNIPEFDLQSSKKLKI